MRLSEFEADIIKQSVYALDPDADVYLFGSRVDDHERGGDIDLLIISEKLRPIDKINIKAMIFKELEEQKIDITISRDIERPFVKLALAQGVPL